MRTLRLLLAVGLGLAPTLAATAAGSTPAFAGGGSGMTLTATMDGQDQRLLVGTRHTVHISLADTPGEADLRDITISLNDLDPGPLLVTCPTGQNGHLSLEPDESLECTAIVTAEAGFRTLVARATAHVPSEGMLVRTDPLHYDGFMPPPPPPRAPVVHAPLTPEPASGRPPHAPVFTPPPPLDPPSPADPPAPAVGGPGKAPVVHGCVDGPAGGADADCCGTGRDGGSKGCCSDGTSAAKGCCSGSESAADGCCGADRAGDRDACCGPHSAACCSGHAASSASRCCGSAGRSESCVKRGGLAFTGMSMPMLAGAASGGLLLVAGGFVLVRRFAKR